MLIEIRVRPNASRNHVGGTAGDPPRLIVSVQAPAVDGKANVAVIAALAKAFELRRRDVVLVSGELGRDKRIRLEGEAQLLLNRHQELCNARGIKKGD